MKTSFSTLALTVGLLASGSFTAVYAQEVQAAQQNQSVSIGEQTKSDLADWRKAGFDNSTYLALSYDVFGKDYQQRLATYKQLRAAHAQGTAQS